MTKSLLTRALSAIVAVGIMGLLYYSLGVNGLKLVVYFAVFVSAYELTSLLLHQQTVRLHKILFLISTWSIFHLATHYPAFALNGFSIIVVLFFVCGLFSHRKFPSTTSFADYNARSLLGFVYVGLLPSFAYRLLDLPNGVLWFGVLLGTVFAGDVGAYLVGVLIGRNKIAPDLSPNKTWEGAFGGILGSLGVGYGFSKLLPHVPLAVLLALSVSVAVVAQSGDFFESLIKRVAGMKDSGKIMPGHGGALDRIDGVLFASPIVMIAASLFESL